jgi:3-oxoadipate enol-lactonase
LLSGRLDIDSVQLAADHVLREAPNVGDVVWPDVAHLPSTERPDDFAELVNDWVTRVTA